MLTQSLSAWLDPQNPYKHFNDKKIGCYQRLWELEEGDEGNDNVRFEGARGWEAAAAAADAADEAERLRQQEQQQQAPVGGDVAAVAPPPEVPIPPPAPVPVPAPNMAVIDAHALLLMNEGQIQEVINNMPEEAAEQLIVDLLAAAGIDDGPGAHGQPGWRIPGLARRAPGRPRQQRLPRLGGGGQFARPAGGDYGARRMNDGHAARREVAALGQHNYVLQVRGEDGIGPPEIRGGGRDRDIDEIGGNRFAEPEVPVEEPPAFVVVPPRGRNGRGRERGRGR